MYVYLSALEYVYLIAKEVSSGFNESLTPVLEPIERLKQISQHVQCILLSAKACRLSNCKGLCNEILANLLNLFTIIVMLLFSSCI